MNYILEINAFYDWLETNKVSDSSIVLWHALMHINNKCGWKREFAVAISTIENKTGMSKSSILRSRNALAQAGRIVFRSREGQQSAVYSLIAFHGGAQSDTQTVTQTVTQSDTQTVPIPKLNETKLNETKVVEAGASPPVVKKEKFSYEKFTDPANLPFTGEAFISNWEKLLKTKKWRNKSESAMEATVTKMQRFNEEFMTLQIESALVGEWQGLFFSNTESDFQKFLLGNGKTTFEKKVQGMNSTAAMALQLITQKEFDNEHGN